MYFNVSPVRLKENKIKIEKNHVPYKTVGLSSCRTIELLDYRAVGLSIRSLKYMWNYHHRYTSKHLSLNLCYFSLLYEFIKRPISYTAHLKTSFSYAIILPCHDFKKDHDLPLCFPSLKRVQDRLSPGNGCGMIVCHFQHHKCFQILHVEISDRIITGTLVNKSEIAG